MSKNLVRENVPLSRFGVLVAQLESIGASASQQSPDPLLVMRLIWDKWQLVAAAPEKTKPAFPPLPLAARTGSTALEEYKGPVLKEEEEDLEVKLRRILENVPVRVSNTSGSSVGSGSGDFHQYRQMRRREQDRLARMDVDYQRRKELAEFTMRREERMKAAEERTVKK
ncbi:hypothetical protein OIU85_027107, partial [Salix viminalis]